MSSHPVTRTPPRSVFALPGTVVDVLFVIVAVIAPTIVLAVHPERHHQSLGVVNVIAALIATPLLLGRRQRPLLAAVLGVSAAVLITVIAHDRTVLLSADFVLLYTLSSRLDRVRAIKVGVTAAVALFVTAALRFPNGPFATESYSVLAWSLMALAAGDAVRSRREYIAAVEERARKAEQTREEEARRRVIEERLRIARELHDVVAHHMAVINVQAGVAGHLLRSNPAEAESALAIVRTAGRAVLDELGGLLSVLRNADDTEPPAAPLPTLQQLNALVDSFTAAGLRVEWRSSGALHPMSQITELTVYRIVEEALTNAHKYGDGRALVEIAETSTSIHVRIANRVAVTDGHQQLDDRRAGLGLVGMRERVAAAGGTVEIGPTPDGTFQIEVDLPFLSVGPP